MLGYVRSPDMSGVAGQQKNFIAEPKREAKVRRRRLLQAHSCTSTLTPQKRARLHKAHTSATVHSLEAEADSSTQTPKSCSRTLLLRCNGLPQATDSPADNILYACSTAVDHSRRLVNTSQTRQKYTMQAVHPPRLPGRAACCGSRRSACLAPVSEARMPAILY